MRRQLMCAVALAGAVAGLGLPGTAAATTADRPNIVYILADDLGYGDLSALNPQGKLKTVHLDRLAAEGMTFTDAHSGSAVCTPTRYGILTGRYAWRTRLQSGVLGGWSPPLIAPGRMTVASLLKSHGYHTGCFGKWHLGMNWAAEGDAAFGDGIDPKVDPKSVDYARPIRNGPCSVGFDRYFGIAASLDMPPYVFISDDHATAMPTARKKWIREGPAAPDFEAVDVLPALVRESTAYIAEQAKSGQPFFVYLPLNSPHTPIVPSPAFAGKSGIGDYGDFVLQTDDAVGRVLKALDEAKVADRTLIIFTSDNGCSPSADFAALATHGHNPSHVFRGMKADIFEGGHHIPFLARWPGRVKAGSACDQTICLTDLLATCAEILGAKLPDDAGEDSVSILPALLGTASGPLREATVHHSINGSFAIRQGPWKLELCPDSGGWSDPKPGTPAAQGLPPTQLYNIADEISERRNVAADHLEIVERLTKLLEKYVADGRSTPGATRTNDVPVKIIKERPVRKAKKAAK